MRITPFTFKLLGMPILVACLAAGLSLGAETQAPAPSPPNPNPGPDSSPTAMSIKSNVSVEDRLRSLETTNQQLLKQIQILQQQMQQKKQLPQAVVPLQPAPPTALTPAPAEAAGKAMDAINDELQIKDDKDALGVPMKARFGRALTNNGVWFESPNKNFTMHAGGRTQWDTGFFQTSNAVQYGPNGIGKLRDGTDFRRVRFRFEGTFYEQMQYVMEFDIINSALNQTSTSPISPLTGYNNLSIGIPVPTDLYVAFRNLPFGTLRIGNQKEPWGFERLTSSRGLNFMERSFNNDAFYSGTHNGFVPGVQAFNTMFDKSATWAGGMFKNITNPGDYAVGGGNWAFVGRLTWLPIYEDDGRELLHLGITGRQSGYDNGRDQLRVRGPERAGGPALWPLYANTAAFNASGGQQDINLEIASVLGPWTVSAEYDFHFSHEAFRPGLPSLGTAYFSGGYVEVLYFLTGERRAWNKDVAVFDRVIPKENAYLVKNKKSQEWENGTGAWQIGIRYNYLNLDSGYLQGGVLNDITLGLNWFHNPNSKVQWNYSITERHSPGGQSDGQIQGFGVRYAMDY